MVKYFTRHWYFLSLLFLALLLLVAPVKAFSVTADVTNDDRPNFLVILVDDLGYGDLGVYGNEIINTPNIDKLAEEGMQLTNFYASAPMCSPSRAGLLTGRTPYRMGVYDWIAPNADMHMPASEQTVATLLRDAGYATALSGKWHLNGRFNSAEQPQPNDHGFQYWFGVQYSQPHLDPKGFYRNGLPVETPGYAADVVANDAVNWLSNTRDKNKPFFQFVNFLEPHEPIMSPPELVKKYQSHGIKAEYYANVDKLDQAIGKIIHALDEQKLRENTLVIFSSDNGPAQYTPDGYFNKSHGSAGPLKGFKRHMFEGGIRVPGIVRWPDGLTAGKTSDQAVSNIDILPTLLALANVSLPTDKPLDGIDLSPIFTAKALKRTVPLHWHFYDPWGGPQSLLRQGDFVLAASWDTGDFHPKKAIYNPKEKSIIDNAKLSDFELYDLKQDIHQDHDVTELHPILFKQMKAKLIALHAEVMAESKKLNH
jgi:arylsulfatase A